MAGTQIPREPRAMLTLRGPQRNWSCFRDPGSPPTLGAASGLCNGSIWSERPPGHSARRPRLPVPSAVWSLVRPGACHWWERPQWKRRRKTGRLGKLGNNTDPRTTTIDCFQAWLRAQAGTPASSGRVGGRGPPMYMLVTVTHTCSPTPLWAPRLAHLVGELRSLSNGVG